MSWHFSQALVEAYSQVVCLGMNRYAQSKSTGTEGTFSWHGKTTEFCRYFPSGTTSGHSTAFRGADVLTWYREVFPAKPIPSRLEVVTRRMIFGRKCGESWQRQLPGTYLPRTLLAKPSTPRPKTSKRWVTASSALPFPRRTWVLTTFGDATGFLHTPTETANYKSRSMMKWRGCREFVRVFGEPSPTNAEWMMGWPIGWTALNPLEKDKWHAWLTRHGVS